MRKIFLESNPFYVLEVMPNEKRGSIISKAEEKAFFSDDNKCEEAQAKLLNPEKSRQNQRGAYKAQAS